MLLHIQETIKYLELVSSKLNQLPEEKELVLEIQETVEHLREILQHADNQEKLKNSIDWILKAKSILILLRDLIANIF